MGRLGQVCDPSISYDVREADPGQLTIRIPFYSYQFAKNCTSGDILS